MDRRNFITSIAVFPSLAWASPPTTATRPEHRNAEHFQRLMQSSARLLDPTLAEITGFALIDVASGEVLDSYRSEMELPPASVTKVMTTIYGRHILGPDFRFVTRILATGPLKDGIIQGDLYLVGGGDPALDTDELAELAEDLVRSGVRGVTGQFYVDGSALPRIAEIDASQPDYLGYNPSICGLNLNFNRVYFEWKHTADGYDLSLDARGVQHKPLVRWVSIQDEERGAPVFRYTKVNGHDRWSVARSALGSRGGRWLPVRQPADYAGEVFRTLAAAAGLTLPTHKHGVANGQLREVARFESKALDEVLRWMLKYSNNLTAEAIGLTASIKLGYRPTSLEHSAALMGQWIQEHLGVSAGHSINHSGLTDQSRVGAGRMAAMLAHKKGQEGVAGLFKGFNMVPRDGKTMISDELKVVAKTGTLNFTRGLAGYLETGGKKYSFAIFTADLSKRATIPMAQRERARGAKTWSGKAKRQEQALLRHWVMTLP